MTNFFSLLNKNNCIKQICGKNINIFLTFVHKVWMRQSPVNFQGRV